MSRALACVLACICVCVCVCVCVCARHRHVPSTTLSFAIKDAIGRAMPAYDPATQQREYALSRIAAGGAAGVIALAIVYP